MTAVVKGALQIIYIALLRWGVDPLQATTTAQLWVCAAAGINVHGLVGDSAEACPQEQSCAKSARTPLSSLAMHLNDDSVSNFNSC